MERAFEKSSEFKDYVQDFMEQSLEQRNVHERNERDKLLNTIDYLEVKIAKLEEKVEGLETKPEKVSPKTKSRAKKSKDQKS